MTARDNKPFGLVQLGCLIWTPSRSSLPETLLASRVLVGCHHTHPVRIFSEKALEEGPQAKTFKFGPPAVEANLTEGVNYPETGYSKPTIGNGLFKLRIDVFPHLRAIENWVCESIHLSPGEAAAGSELHQFQLHEADAIPFIRGIPFVEVPEHPC